MSVTTIKSLTTNLFCLVVVLTLVALFEWLIPKFVRWLKYYMVYRHYPPEFARQCICGETFLMHEGDGGACEQERCYCRKFVPIKLEEQL